MAVTARTLISAEGTEHENTTTEGSIATHAFAVGTLTPGKLYLFDGLCVVNDNNGADTLTPAIRFGSSATVASNTAVISGAAVDVADGDLCAVHGMIHCQSATRIVITAWIQGPDANGTTAVYGGGAVITIDQATAYRLDFTLDWSASHADNEAAAAAWTVIEIA